jgi:serine/threonine protein kinase
VSFIESYLFENELWLVMELCDLGSLHEVKEAKAGVGSEPFTEKQLVAIMGFR